MLGTANDQLLFRLLEAMLRCEPAVIFTELEAAASEGVDFGVMVEQMMGLLRDLLVVASGSDASLMLFCSTPQFDQVKSMANAFGLHRILASLQILDQTHTKMRYSTQGRVLTELALVRIAHLDHFQMISVLLDRLREGNLPLPTTASAQPVVPSVKPVQRVIPPPAMTDANVNVNVNPNINTNVNVSVPSVNTSPSNIRPNPNTAALPHSDAPISGQTPLQRFNEASAPPKIDLDSMTDEKAVTVWRDAIETIPGMLATYAANYKKLTFEKPNGFLVVFDNRLAKELCERESPRLQNVLSQTIGKAIRIRFELIEEKTPTPAPVQKANRSALFKEVVENPFVKKVGEIFDAELYDVR
jgi:DNA polymerase III gamma/tau subunit